MAKALRVNTVLRSLDITDNGILSEGAVRIGEALCDRICSSAGPFALKGVELRSVAPQLGLPPFRCHAPWSNAEIMRFVHDERDRSVAFCMLAHPRLGAGSGWAELEVGLLRLVLSHPIYWLG